MMSWRASVILIFEYQYNDTGTVAIYESDHHLVVLEVLLNATTTSTKNILIRLQHEQKTMM